MLSKLKAAARVSQPPTLFGYRLGKGWTATDFLLLEALQLYDESLCRCGFPAWMGHNPDHAGEGLFAVDYAHCLICEKVDEEYKAENRDVTPGDLMRVVNGLYELHAPKWLRRLGKGVTGG